MVHDAGGCAELGARELAERFLSRRLTSAECRFFEAHILLCDRCREEVRLCAAIRELLTGGAQPRA